MSGAQRILANVIGDTAGKAPGPIGKVGQEAERFQNKIADERTRLQRKVGLSTQKPKLLEPIQPDPLPTVVEGPKKKKKRVTGRGSTILATQMNRRRGILDTRNPSILT